MIHLTVPEKPVCRCGRSLGQVESGTCRSLTYYSLLPLLFSSERCFCS